mgnify:FL=1
MNKLQKSKNFKLLMLFVLVSLIGCEAPNQNNPAFLPPQGYTPLSQVHPKDKEFFAVIKHNLQNVGSLVAVYANPQELNLYREGKCSYPTNYCYTIKPNSKFTLEEIKQANLYSHNEP